MISKIGYENKTALQNDEDVPETQKVTDQNMNEIKKVVNDNADELEEFQNSYKVVTEKEVSISPIQPLQNQTLWIQRGKNRFNKYSPFNFGAGGTGNIELQDDGSIITYQNLAESYSKQSQLLLKKNTDYIMTGKVIAINQISGYRNFAYVTVLGYNKNFDDLQIITNTQLSELGDFSISFNSGNNEYWGLSLTGQFGTGGSGNVVFNNIMISEEGGEYEDYVEDKFFIKENNNFSEFINVEKLHSRRVFRQAFSGEVSIGSTINTNADLRQCSNFLIKLSDFDKYIPLQKGKDFLTGTFSNSSNGSLDIFSISLEIRTVSTRLLVENIEKWTISSSGITKDSSSRTVTEIWVEE